MKYLEMEENGETYDEGRSYARGRYGRSYGDGRYSYDDGNSYGRYYDDHRYDDMGYRGGRSRDNNMHEMTDELQEMLNNATDADVKDALKKTIAHIKKNK